MFLFNPLAFLQSHTYTHTHTHTHTHIPFLTPDVKDEWIPENSVRNSMLYAEIKPAVLNWDLVSSMQLTQALQGSAILETVLEHC